MPRITFGPEGNETSIEVGDEFFRLPPEKQQEFLRGVTDQIGAGATSSGPVPDGIGAGQPKEPPPGYIDQALQKAQQFGSGVIDTATGLAGLPRDFANMTAAGAGKAIEYFSGQKPSFDPVQVMNKLPLPFGPSADQYKAAIERNITGPLPAPQTTGDKYARTVGQFVGGAALGPASGMRQFAGNLAKYGVLPGIAAETAGQATSGSRVEPYARAGAAMAVGVPAAMLSRPNTAARNIAAATANVGDDVFANAQRIMAESQRRGVTLTWAEAIDQASGGATNVAKLQRIAESGSGNAANRLTGTLAKRPAEMAKAFDDASNTLGPRSAQPSYIGTQTQEAAGVILDRLRQEINKVSAPYYDAAKTVRVPKEVMADLQKVPGFKSALKQVQSNPQLAATIKGLPNDSVGVLNAVKQQLDDMAKASRTPGSGVVNNQTVAAGYKRDAGAVRDIAADLSPDFAEALRIQRSGRQAVLGPAAAGPLGGMANTTKTGTAIQAALGSDRSPQEVARAFKLMAGEAPDASKALLRERLGTIGDRTVKGLTTTGQPDAYGGARLAKQLLQPRSGENISAALKQISPKTERELKALSEVLQATGRRQRLGSMTAFNQEFLNEAKGGPLMRWTGLDITRPLAIAQEKVGQARLGNTMEKLVDLLLSGPEGARRIQEIARNGTGNAKALARVLLMEKSAQESARAAQPVN